ncbi:chitin synthesis regulation, resistance to congo red-domain-containing protein [Bombardia bombarda]|uniref:Chitin synthesis regulation, resistance to congo red-domain-containing protein n=1 Tax=Bombardia bombarda TaxID=252184 RepID=A0AA40BY64_9PEZI|nr:chitin synthesis regulation, resistance to congo red-domain-containing protein [Bombardia bombarda]
MAPLEQLATMVGEIAKRDLYCPSGSYYSGSGCYRYSSWYWWGRWVFAAVLVIIVIALFALVANSRRRRAQGVAPVYGTGWMAPAPPYYPQNPPQYSAQQPVYPQQTGQKFNTNDGYYAAQTPENQEGIQLQQPATTYHRGGGADDVYAPPEGPPPAKRT